MENWDCSSGVVNYLGQCVPNDRSLAAGHYKYTDEEIERQVSEGITPCGNIDENGDYVGLRPGFVVVGTREDGSLITANTCSGNLVENHLPDYVLIDDEWKPYVKYVEVAVIAILSLLILKQLK